MSSLKSTLHCVILFYLIALFKSNFVHAAVLGIDIGEDTIKIASVAPGKGIEIMLDGHSMRTIPSIVFFAENERFYGNSAFNHVLKSPESAASQFKSLLGYQGNASVLIKARNESFVFNNIRPSPSHSEPVAERSSLVFEVPFKREFKKVSSEEALAMTLANIRHFSLEIHKLAINEFAVAVPSYFTHAQRKAIKKASLISGVKLLSLVGENSASGILYASKMKNETSKRVMIINIGYSKMEVTVLNVSLRNNKISKKKDIVETHYAFDESVGGNEYDRVLTSYLLDIFVETNGLTQTDKDAISKNPKIMTRLRIHAEKTKRILSSNPEAYVGIENLYNEKRLSKTINRTDFEKISFPLTQKAVEVIRSVPPNFDEYIFVGGTSRIPFLKHKIAEILKDKKIAETLNPDESSALGTAMRAANFSMAFKFDKITLLQRNVHTVEILLTAIPGNLEKEDEKAKLSVDDSLYHLESKFFKKSAVLFKNSDFFGTKRAVSFKSENDFYGRVFYKKETLPNGQKDLIFDFKTSGIRSFYEKTDKKEVPKVSLIFELTEDGMVFMTKSVAVVKSEVAPAAPENKTELGKNQVNETKEDKDINQTSGETGEKEKLENEADINIIYLNGMTKKGELFDQREIKRSKNLLREFDERDQATLESSKKLNALEEALNQYIELNESENFREVSTDLEKSQMEKAYKKVADWLKNNRKAQLNASEYAQMLSQYKNQTFAAINRFSEKYKLIKAVEYTKEIIEAVRNVVNDTMHNKQWISTDEILNFTNKTKNFVDWVNEKIAKTEAMPKTADPIITSDEVIKGIEKIKKKALEFVMRENVVPPKADNATMSADSNATSANASGSNATNRTKTRIGNRTRRRRIRTGSGANISSEKKKTKMSYFGDFLNKTRSMFNKGSEKKKKVDDQKYKEKKGSREVDEEGVEKIEL